MTDAATDRAHWAARFADELLGFEPAPYPEAPEPEIQAAPATRAAKERADARARAQRARDKDRASRELDDAIAKGLGAIMRRRNIFGRLRDGEEMAKMAVCIEPIFAEAMTVLVTDCGWDRTAASQALNTRLLR